ncbi:MAG TPA: hypothetical protein VNQ99_17790 [Xanthobacteraceae bacterium]|nr:hypothetical protein [Xanthobacteraceae bacterium]
MKLALAGIIALGLAGAAEARNTPCSGKKGGVAYCTKDGKFMCKEGTTSASKRICTGR